MIFSQQKAGFCVELNLKFKKVLPSLLASIAQTKRQKSQRLWNSQTYSWGLSFQNFCKGRRVQIFLIKSKWWVKQEGHLKKKRGGITYFNISLLFPVLSFCECLVCMLCLFTPFLSEELSFISPNEQVYDF